MRVLLTILLKVPLLLGPSTGLAEPLILPRLELRLKLELAPPKLDDLVDELLKELEPELDPKEDLDPLLRLYPLIESPLLFDLPDLLENPDPEFEPNDDLDPLLRLDPLIESPLLFERPDLLDDQDPELEPNEDLDPSLRLEPLRELIDPPLRLDEPDLLENREPEEPNEDLGPLLELDPLIALIVFELNEPDFPLDCEPRLYSELIPLSPLLFEDDKSRDLKLLLLDNALKLPDVESNDFFESNPFLPDILASESPERLLALNDTGGSFDFPTIATVSRQILRIIRMRRYFFLRCEYCILNIPINVHRKERMYCINISFMYRMSIYRAYGHVEVAPCA